MKNRLQLSRTIRTATADELPITKENLEWIEESKTAKIVEGFTITNNQTRELPFDFFSEINIDNSKLWSLFKTFLLSFPDEISFIFGHIDSEPIYTKYDDKFKILNVVEQFETELTQDGFLEFGIIYHDKKMLKEVFVKNQNIFSFGESIKMSLYRSWRNIHWNKQMI